MVAQINQTQVSAIDFLQAVLVQFGFSPFKMKKAELHRDAQQLPHRAVRRRAQGAADRRRGAEPVACGCWRRSACSPASRPPRRRCCASSSPASRSSTTSSTRPELEQLTQRVRLRFHLQTLSQTETRGLHPAPPGSRRRRRPRDLRRGHLRRDLPLHRRRAAADQHAVRHRDDGRLHRRPRHRDARRHRQRRAGAALAGVRRTAPHQQRRRAAERQPRCRARTAAATARPAARRSCWWPPTGAPCRRCRCSPGRLIVGRTPDNDVQIDSRFVSRHHCQIITTHATRA